MTIKSNNTNIRDFKIFVDIEKTSVLAVFELLKEALKPCGYDVLARLDDAQRGIITIKKR